MLDEHFGGYGDDEGGVVGAGLDVVVCVNDFLYAGHYGLLIVSMACPVELIREGDVRG